MSRDLRKYGEPSGRTGTDPIRASPDRSDTVPVSASRRNTDGPGCSGVAPDGKASYGERDLPGLPRRRGSRIRDTAGAGLRDVADDRPVMAPLCVKTRRGVRF